MANVGRSSLARYRTRGRHRKAPPPQPSNATPPRWIGYTVAVFVAIVAVSSAAPGGETKAPRAQEQPQAHAEPGPRLLAPEIGPVSPDLSTASPRVPAPVTTRAPQTPSPIRKTTEIEPAPLVQRTGEPTTTERTEPPAPTTTSPTPEPAAPAPSTPVPTEPPSTAPPSEPEPPSETEQPPPETEPPSETEEPPAEDPPAEDEKPRLGDLLKRLTGPLLGG